MSSIAEKFRHILGELPEHVRNALDEVAERVGDGVHVMPEKVENAFGLTLLSPIRPGRVPDDLQPPNPHEDADHRPHDITHDAAIRGVLQGLDTRAASPLAKVPGVHLARWVVIDDVPSEGFPAHLDRLKSKYLLLTACFDGELDDFLEAMRTRAGGDVERIYRHCVNFPGVADARAFRDWMMRCKLYSTFFFPAYPEATLPGVLRALDGQRRVAEFALAHQGQGDDAALLHDFRAFLGTLQTAPTPAPGIL
jgi:hypothetical protein